MVNVDNIVIVGAYRTAIGNFNGSLESQPAHEMSKVVIEKLLAETGVKGTEISEVIMGQVLTSGTGQNPARQASLIAGIPNEAPAWTINQVCGSGLRSVALGAGLCQGSDIILAGGHENMSQCPHGLYLRSGVKMGDAKLVDFMIKDGLTDASSGNHMGITAENIAEQFNISRAEQDQFALESQNKAEKAQKAGYFKDEIVPYTISSRKGDTVFEEDEFIKHGLTIDKLEKLKPAFKKEGTVTAGNASGINDGAAVVMLMTEEEAKKRSLKPLATIKSFAHAGVDPSIMGTGPIPASKKALELAGWSVDDLDLIEANEAFAAQAISVNKGIEWDIEKVNVNGGAIALGHPIGASGARVLVTLLHQMKRQNAKKGLATLCVGGGMGVAMCLER